MIRAFLFVIVGAFSVCAQSEPLRFWVRCFTHEGERVVNLKFATTYIPEGRLNIGYIQYEKSNASIQLSYVGAEEVVFSEDRPVEVTSTWREVFKSKFGGEYTVVSQGANIYGFSYKGVSGRVMSFKYNDSATLPEYTGCSWE